MVNAVNKNYLLICGFLIFVFYINLVNAYEPFPLEGKVKINLTFDELNLTKDINKDFSFVNTHFLFYNSLVKANGIATFNVVDISNGLITFGQENNLAGSAVINIEQNKISLKDMKLSIELDASLCLPQENNIFCLFPTDVKINNIKNGEFFYGVNLINYSLEHTSFVIQGKDILDGALSIDFSNITLSHSVFDSIVEYYQGEVKTLDDNLLNNGEIRIDINGQSFYSEIQNGIYGPVRVIGLPNSRILFYVNNIPVAEKTLTMDEKENTLNLILGITAEKVGFSDEDSDGVADNKDKCPNSTSKKVDVRGCNCEQKKCAWLCDDTGIEPFCLNTCNNDIKNGNEEGVDCGGNCKPCKLPITSAVTEVLSICDDCRICGCTQGFSCENDGKCRTSVKLAGRKCKINDYFYDLKRIDCQKKGASWITEDKDKYFKIKVSGFPLISQIASSSAKKKFKEATICIDTEDLGCIREDTKCFGEPEFPTHRMKVEQVIKDEAQKNINSNIPGILKFFINIKLDVNLQDFQVGMPYDCKSIKIEAENACKSVIINGDSKIKADMLFIGDGFSSGEELNKTVLQVIDYQSNFSGTVNEGLFSIEPWKSNKNKFNILIMHSNGEIKYKVDKKFPANGEEPVYSDVYKVANRCPQYDYIVVLSKLNSYRSNCWLTQPCRVSLAKESLPGRLVTHEFGHGFAGLADEYFNLLNRKDYPAAVEELIPVIRVGPNCKTSKDEAQQSWGDLVGKEGIGFFKSCGDDCGVVCESYIRPTFNSVMRHRNENCGLCVGCDEVNHKCPQGPPFDKWYAVNDGEINKVLNKYS